VQAAAGTAREAVSNNRQAENAPAGVSPLATDRPAPSPVDAAQAAVRAGVQQAVAAQVAGDGARQSLDAYRQETLLAARSAPAPTVDTPATAFNALLAEVTTTGSVPRVSVPVGEPGWARAVGEQLVWHVSQNIQSASLRLNPQHLGPLEMQVQMDGDKATLAFASQHAVVREALESALPRLREMFAQGGLEIIDVNVSQQHASAREDQQSGGSRAGADDDVAVDDELPVDAIGGLQAGQGLVDYYI